MLGSRISLFIVSGWLASWALPRLCCCGCMRAQHFLFRRLRLGLVWQVCWTCCSPIQRTQILLINICTFAFITYMQLLLVMIFTDKKCLYIFRSLAKSAVSTKAIVLLCRIESSNFGRKENLRSKHCLHTNITCMDIIGVSKPDPV